MGTIVSWHGANVWKDMPWRTYCLQQTSANKQLHNLTVKHPGSISMLLKVTRRSNHGGHPICSAIVPETMQAWLGNNSFAFQKHEISKRVGYTFVQKWAPSCLGTGQWSERIFHGEPTACCKHLQTSSSTISRSSTRAVSACCGMSLGVAITAAIPFAAPSCLKQCRHGWETTALNFKH